MAEGYRWRRERQWERAAWMVAHLLQPFVEQELSIDMLLGRKRARTREDMAQDFTALWERLHPGQE